MRPLPFLAFVVALLPQAGSAQTPPAGTSTTGLHRIVPGSPQELQELFRYTGETLPILSAHRGGAKAGFPENCLETFENTLRHSFAMLEIDPRFTRDGEIVVHHDATLDRTTTGTGRVADWTLEELKQLRLKDAEGNVTPYQIPTLDEVLEWARGKTILVLDSKDVPIAARVRKIEQHDAEGYAMLIVGNVAGAQECHALNANIMMEVMMPDQERYHAFDESGVPWSNLIAFVGHEPSKDQVLLQKLHDKGVCCLAGTSRNIDKELILQSAANAGNVEQQYHALLQRGIDLIETDLPREVWPLLYADTAIPPSKSRFVVRP